MMNKKIKLLAAAIALAGSPLWAAGDFESGLRSVENGLAGYKAAHPAGLPEPVPAETAEAAPTAQFGVNTGKEDEIFAMSGAALAAASADQKVEMLRTLVRNAVPSQQGSAGVSAQEYRERTIARILASAPDAAAFDRLYYRLDPDKLRRAVSDYGRISGMVSAARAAAAPGDWDGLSKYIETVTGAGRPSRNQIKFLIDGPSAMAEGGKALKAAKRSIHIELFQLQSDNIGRGLAKLLSEKAKAGVTVRLLIDAKGSELKKDPDLAGMLDSMRDSGVWVIAKEPPPLDSHLDHRKVVVIDGNKGFTGGMNVGRFYQVDWHDQQTLIIGPAVTELQKAFSERWFLAGGGLLSDPGLFPFVEEAPEGAEAQVVTHTGLDDHNIKAMYLRAIGTAQSSIRIANPYFTDQDIIEALCAAARRGVRVQLVLPQDNDEKVVQHASRSSYPELIRAGVEIYEYRGRMAHEKVAVMDGRWATFGSSNLDARSLKNNDELNMAVNDPGVAGDISTRLFDADLLKSERILHYSPDIFDQAADNLNGVI